MAPIIVGYWKQRALGQPIRLLLAYKEVEFIDKFYDVGDAPYFDKSSWHNNKYQLGLDFPNLPYIIDGDVKLSQSRAIMRYFGRKYDLMGDTEQDHQRIDVLEGHIGDMQNNFWNLTYFSRPTDFKNNLQKFKEDSKAGFELIDKFLGSDRKFFIGDKITFVDFFAYEMLEQHRLLSTEIIDDFTNLKEYLKRFENLPEMKKFMNSEKFIKFPVNNKYALWRQPHEDEDEDV